MVNVTVIRVKDTFKYLVGIIVVLIILFFLTRYFSYKEVKGKILKTNININLKALEESFIEECFDEMFISKNTKISNKEKDNSKKILESEIIAEKGIIKKEEVKEEVKNENTNIKDSAPIVNEVPKTNVKTEILDKSKINTKYTNTYKDVQIKNETEFELTEEIITPNINLENKKDILIFHTHTCESYTPTEKCNYTASGNFRTIDLNYSVSKVGDELEKHLKSYGFNVFHDKTFHDYPAYTGSYNRSLKTVQADLNNMNSQIVIDLHRDAVGANSGYKPLVKIGDDYCAQIMFVIGTNGGGLTHPNWADNLKFAIKIQEKANELYPGLFKPIILRNSRYNQHVAKAACIMEVGATGNTLEESITSMKYVSKIINEALK